MSTIPNFIPAHFKRSTSPAYAIRPDNERACAYIALPAETPCMDVEDILWWSKTRHGPELWIDPNGSNYLVYLVYAKLKYIHHVTEELVSLGGFYLRNKED